MCRFSGFNSTINSRERNALFPKKNWCRDRAAKEEEEEEGMKCRQRVGK